MFNLKNPTETALLHLMAKSEGVLHREDFPTKNLYYKMKNEGYISKNGKITDKFKREYTKTVDKTAKFGSTGSDRHGRGVMEILKCLPHNALMSTQSAAQLTEEHKAFAKTAEYKAAVSEIRQRMQEQRQALQNQIKESAPLAAAQLRQQIRELSRFERKLEDKHRGVSPCDLKSTLTRDQAAEVVERLREQHPEAAERLQQIIDATPAETVTVLFEIITPNYAAHQIFSHEVYAEAVSTPVIFIPTR